MVRHIKTHLNDLLLVFLVSSSLLTFLPTMTYLGIAFHLGNRPNNVPYEYISIIVPFLYGISGVVNYLATQTYGENASIFVGALFGFMLSFIGRFHLDLPKLLFGMEDEDAYIVHLYAIVIYAIIFRFIETPVHSYVLPK